MYIAFLRMNYSRGNKSDKSLIPEFVEYIPTDLKPGVLYISMKYATAVHLCACGCGEKVVTPISRSDWKLLFDGETITLRPSIGNFEYKCRSHYFITENRIEWCKDMPNHVKPRKKKKWKWRMLLNKIRTLF